MIPTSSKRGGFVLFSLNYLKFDDIMTDLVTNLLLNKLSDYDIIIKIIKESVCFPWIR